MRRTLAILFVVITGIVNVRYALLAARGDIHPTLATWLLFWVAVVLSFCTYRNTEQRSAVDNIANTSDVVTVSIVLFALGFRYGWRGFLFGAFDAWCLGASALIFFFWIVSRRHVAANLATQGILVVAYIPTIRNLLVARENPESFLVWGAILVASLIAFWIAAREKNKLAMLYAVRAAVSVGVVLILMARIELVARSGVGW